MAKSNIRKAWDAFKKEAVSKDATLKGCCYLTARQKENKTATIVLGDYASSYETFISNREQLIEKNEKALANGEVPADLIDVRKAYIEQYKKQLISLVAKREQFQTPMGYAVAKLNEIRQLTSWQTFCEVAHVYSVAYEIEADAYGCMVIKARINYFGETIENI